jgi:glutathione S-transferase
VTDSLFHVADASEWEAARALGRYERSTRGLSLAEVGFIHLSTAEQWPGVLERYYADHHGELVLLTIDPTRVGSEIRWEPAHPEADELFPHLYGGLDAGAVTDARPLDR